MKRFPLILVCGPWSGGTSAVAGLLAKAGLAAPGPYLITNDPRTTVSYEMLAFREALQGLASERTLQRTATPETVVDALTGFRDGPLTAALRAEGIAEGTPVMLKHALSALLLPEITRVFDTRIVGVVRPVADIEATRRRRRWPESFGAMGANVIYGHLSPIMSIRTRRFSRSATGRCWRRRPRRSTGSRRSAASSATRHSGRKRSPS